MTCPDCEYHKQRAALWRHEAYRLGGTPLPWDADVAIAKAVAAEREACAKVCDSLHDKIELVEKTEHYPGEYGSEYDAGQGNAISECVDAIRARGET